MYDARLRKLAEQLVNYSVSLQKGENLLITCSPQEIPLVKELVRSAYRAGGYPHVTMEDRQIQREILLGLEEKQMESIIAYKTSMEDEMDALISVGTAMNPSELSDVPAEKMNLWSISAQKWSLKRRSGGIKWCVCIYPTPLYAGQAGMSTEAFEDYYFRVCCMDYQRFGAAMERLKQIIEPVDQVRIISPGTDLVFSIRGIDKRVSAGDRNIPDGEVYTSPVRESINGKITFNVPSYNRGIRFENICLTFCNGKAIHATGSPEKELNKILDIDSNARYTGEFAFGLNPYLNTPVGLTLFDEKINGSIHIAMGNSLDVTDNGNRSAIHWDLILMQTPEMGGGEIYIDGILLRKDGKFVLPELEALNGTVDF